MEDCVRAYCRRTTMRILTLIQPTRRRTLGRARARRGRPSDFSAIVPRAIKAMFQNSGCSFESSPLKPRVLLSEFPMKLSPLDTTFVLRSRSSSCQSRGANGGTAARAGRKERARVAVLPSSAMPPKKKQSHINRMAAQVRCRVASPSSTPPTRRSADIRRRSSSSAPRPRPRPSPSASSDALPLRPPTPDGAPQGRGTMTHGVREAAHVDDRPADGQHRRAAKGWRRRCSRWSRSDLKSTARGQLQREATRQGQGRDVQARGDDRARGRGDVRRSSDACATRGRALGVGPAWRSRPLTRRRRST